VSRTASALPPRRRTWTSGGLAQLAIEPGVTLRFGAGGALRVEPSVGTNDATGALVALGTVDAPIVFTSAAATPAAGDWLGVRFGQRVAVQTFMRYVRVEYAGGGGSSGSDSCLYPPQPQTGPNDAAIRILGGAEPLSVFIDNTTIFASAKHGIDRGFRSDTKPDFSPTNTFTQVAGCRQTWPRDLNGACPDPPPCP
jgi:hypothetical protein